MVILQTQIVKNSVLWGWTSMRKKHHKQVKKKITVLLEKRLEKTILEKWQDFEKSIKKGHYGKIITQTCEFGAELQVRKRL